MLHEILLKFTVITFWTGKLATQYPSTCHYYPFQSQTQNPSSQTGSGNHPTSYPMGTTDVFTGVGGGGKVAGMWSSNDFTGNQTSELPAFSIVSDPTTLPRALWRIIE
jgi:hypothetical protein